MQPHTPLVPGQCRQHEARPYGQSSDQSIFANMNAQATSTLVCRVCEWHLRTANSLLPMQGYRDIEIAKSCAVTSHTIRLTNVASKALFCTVLDENVLEAGRGTNQQADFQSYLQVEGGIS